MTHSPERGSIIFYILIAVAVFAALSYAIASSLRGNAGVSNQKLDLIASEVIAIGTRVADAATRMRLKDIASTQVSLEAPGNAGYTNPNCTTTDCLLFGGEGGGIVWETPPAGAQVAAHDWIYTPRIAIQNLGDNTSELVAILPDINVDVCQRINLQLGIAQTLVNPNEIPAITGVIKFIGTYGASVNFNDPMYMGQKAACFVSTGLDGTALAAPYGKRYHYYHVVLVN